MPRGHRTEFSVVVLIAFIILIWMFFPSREVPAKAETGFAPSTA